MRALHIDHPIFLGQNRKKRSTELIHAAEVGNATRLELLLQAGANVNAVDLYQISSLQYAACHGHLESVKMLMRWGAMDDLMLEDDEFTTTTVNKAGGDNRFSSSPLRAAFANGHSEIVELLSSHSDHFIESPTILQFNDTSAKQRLKTTLIPLDSDHSGAGSFYIDNAVCDDCIDALVLLHEALQKNSSLKEQQHGSKRSQHTMQSTNAARRSHYCDTEGWVTSPLNSALEQATAQQSLRQQAFSHVRFISYLGENTTSFLAPHRDFPVLDRSSGQLSTHTFILYLTTVSEGGETALFDYLPPKEDITWREGATTLQNNNISNNTLLANSRMMSMDHTVQPVRGRLFVFPHGCPHAGRQVVEGSKLILRGDAC